MKREDWLDRLLTDWAEWVMDYSRWIGCGAGIYRAEPSAEQVQVKRDAWSYSNPVLSEIMASLRAKKGREAVLHKHITTLPDFWAEVVVYRHCGIPRAVPSTVRMANLAPKGGTLNDFCPLDYIWSGPLAWVHVAELTGETDEQCQSALVLAKCVLSDRLDHDRKIRFGEVMPDGGMTREQYLASLNIEPELAESRARCRMMWRARTVARAA